jgi:hypothetical protein
VRQLVTTALPASSNLHTRANGVRHPIDGNDLPTDRLYGHPGGFPILGGWARDATTATRSSTGSGG